MRWPKSQQHQAQALPSCKLRAFCPPDAPCLTAPSTGARGLAQAAASPSRSASKTAGCCHMTAGLCMPKIPNETNASASRHRCSSENQALALSLTQVQPLTTRNHQCASSSNVVTHVLPIGQAWQICPAAYPTAGSGQCQLAVLLPAAGVPSPEPANGVWARSSRLPSSLPAPLPRTCTVKHRACWVCHQGRPVRTISTLAGQTSVSDKFAPSSSTGGAWAWCRKSHPNGRKLLLRSILVTIIACLGGQGRRSCCCLNPLQIC